MSIPLPYSIAMCILGCLFIWSLILLHKSVLANKAQKDKLNDLGQIITEDILYGEIGSLYGSYREALVILEKKDESKIN